MAGSEDTVKYIKDNPLKSLAAVLGIVGMLITSVWAAEARFNQSAEILLVQNDVLEYQIRQQEDVVFEYDLKIEDGTATNAEKAMRKRADEYLKTLREKKKERDKNN